MTYHIEGSLFNSARRWVETVAQASEITVVLADKI